MLFQQVILAASIRMLALTLFVIAIVYVAPVRLWAAAPVRLCAGAPVGLWAAEDKFTRLGASGRTALSLIDQLSLPASAKPDTVLAAAIRPAAFGLLELSDAVFIVPLSFATLSLRGTATTRWIDLQPRVMRAWSLTPSFRVGLATSIRITSAQGFSAHIKLLADIHAVVNLDSVWTVSCLVSSLHGPRIHTAVARSIGDYVASVDIALVNGQDIGLLFEAGDVRGEWLRWRASFCTLPLALTAALALPLNNVTTFVCEVTHVEHLGYRTMLGVEFVP